MYLHVQSFNSTTHPAGDLRPGGAGGLGGEVVGPGVEDDGAARDRVVAGPAARARPAGATIPVRAAFPKNRVMLSYSRGWREAGERSADYMRTGRAEGRFRPGTGPFPAREEGELFLPPPALPRHGGIGGAGVCGGLILGNAEGFSEALV